MTLFSHQNSWSKSSNKWAFRPLIDYRCRYVDIFTDQYDISAMVALKIRERIAVPRKYARKLSMDVELS